MKTTVINFRTYKTLHSWLDFASQGFFSQNELLSLILQKSALEQTSEIGVSRLLVDLLSRLERTRTGDSIVLAARVPVYTRDLIADCSSRRGKTPSNWCSLVLIDWQDGFQVLEETHTGDAWLGGYAGQLRSHVASLRDIYAQKQAKLTSKETP